MRRKSPLFYPLLQRCHSHRCILRMPGQRELEEAEQGKEGERTFTVTVSLSLAVWKWVSKHTLAESSYPLFFQTAQRLLVCEEGSSMQWGGVLKKSGLSPRAHEKEQRSTVCVWLGFSHTWVALSPNQACSHTLHEDILFIHFWKISGVWGSYLASWDKKACFFVCLFLSLGCCPLHRSFIFFGHFLNVWHFGGQY